MQNKLSIKVARFGVFATRLRRAEGTRDALLALAEPPSALELSIATEAVVVAQADLADAERDLAELVGDELAARRIRHDLERRNRVLEGFVLGSSALFVLVWAANMVFVIAS